MKLCNLFVRKRHVSKFKSGFRWKVKTRNGRIKMVVAISVIGD